MCLTHVLGPLIGGFLAAPVHLYLTDSKNTLESWKIKSFTKIDQEMAMTERKLNNDVQSQRNTEINKASPNVRENIQRSEVDHGFQNQASQDLN